AAGHRRREQRVAPGGGAHRGDQVVPRRVLEQEPAGTGPQRLVDVFVKVEGGEHDHLGRGGGARTSRGRGGGARTSGGRGGGGRSSRARGPGAAGGAAR